MLEESAKFICKSDIFFHIYMVLNQTMGTKPLSKICELNVGDSKSSSESVFCVPEPPLMLKNNTTMTV